MRSRLGQAKGLYQPISRKGCDCLIRFLTFFYGSQRVLSSAKSHSPSRAVIQWLGGTFVVTWGLLQAVGSFVCAPAAFPAAW